MITLHTFQTLLNSYIKIEMFPLLVLIYHLTEIYHNVQCSSITLKSDQATLLNSNGTICFAVALTVLKLFFSRLQVGKNLIIVVEKSCYICIQKHWPLFLFFQLFSLNLQGSNCRLKS